MLHIRHILDFSTTEMEKKTKIKLSGSVLKKLTCTSSLVGVGLPRVTPA
jgi:hypothetical protein